MTPSDRFGEAAVRLQRGVDAQIAGYAEAAERCYLETLEIDPQIAQARNLIGTLRLDAGRVPEAASWLRQAIALEPANATFFAHYGNILAALGTPALAAVAYRRSVSLAPTDAGWLNNLGAAALSLGRHAEAVLWSRRSLELRPLYGSAWNNLALALANPGDLPARDAAWRCAIATEPGIVEALGNLAVGRLQQDDGELAERYAGRALAADPLHVGTLNTLGAARLTRDHTRRAGPPLRLALTLRPALRDAHYNLGIAHMSEGRPAEAAVRQTRSLAIDPDYAEAEWNKALAHLLVGNFIDGWRAYESRWRMRSFPTAQRDFGRPRWSGDPLGGRTILVHAEQGHGDTIQFARYLPLLEQRGARVVVECQPALKRLIGQQPCVADVVAQGENLPEFDCHVPFMSLPLLFGTRLESIPAGAPYLSLPDVGVPQKPAIGQKPLSVGLALAGSPTHRRDRFRSLPAEVALDLARALSALPQVRLLSLQKESAGAEFDRLVPPALREADDFLETARIVQDLDLAMSVDTAIAHLAGALAKPGLVLLPFSPDFRWLLDRRDSPWYPSLQLLRQPRPGDWRSVISEGISRMVMLSAKEPDPAWRIAVLQ